jgi:uncharacterized protein (TIGR03000 family)
MYTLLVFMALNSGELLPAEARRQAPSGMRDDGRFFSTDAAARADSRAREFARRYGVSLLIETFPTVPDGQADKVRKMSKEDRTRFFYNWTVERIKDIHPDGIYLLVCKNPGHFRIHVMPKASARFKRDAIIGLRDLFAKELWAGHHDDALQEALAYIESKLDESLPDPAPATVRVRLPEDARLYFDGEETQSTAAVREFISPVLEPGKTYSYSLVGTVVRGGRTVSVRREVDVRAGEVTEVTLAFPRPPAPATLVVRLPADARLSLDGETVRSGGSVRRLESPELPYGKTYSYTITGQVYRDGRTVTDRKVVDVRADQVTEVVLNLPEATAIYSPAGGGSVFYPSTSGSTYSSGGGGGSASYPVTTSSSYTPVGGGGSTFAQGGTGIGTVGGGFAAGGFAGNAFTGGGMPYTSGGGGNTGPGSYALINGQKVFIPAGGHLNQVQHGGMIHGGFHQGGFGGHVGGGMHMGGGGHHHH